jgi:hypothetical protein
VGPPLLVRLGIRQVLIDFEGYIDSFVGRIQIMAIVE